MASCVISTSHSSSSDDANESGASEEHTLRERSSVEVLYDYLKIFPKELGIFDAEPTTVIAQINKQAQYGYNNWRIPTKEELSLMKANNYVGSGQYMTQEEPQGIVLLVTDGEDCVPDSVIILF